MAKCQTGRGKGRIEEMVHGGDLGAMLARRGREERMGMKSRVSLANDWRISVNVGNQHGACETLKHVSEDQSDQGETPPPRLSKVCWLMSMQGACGANASWVV